MEGQPLRADDAQVGAPAGSVEGAGDVREGSIDALVHEVIDAALTRRPRYGAHVWYAALLRDVEGTSHTPPSRNRFDKLLSAERKRRRAAVEEATVRAGEAVGSAIGDAGLEVLPGTPPVLSEDCVFVVSSLTLWRSTGPGYAFGDYAMLARRAGRSRMTEDVFREFVHSQAVVDNVPHGLMPDWWLKKLARLTASRS